MKLFNLDELSYEICYIVLKEYEVQNEVEFFRNMFLKHLIDVTVIKSYRYSDIERDLRQRI
ncbi:MAG: hypothetical protein ACRC4T_25465 [Cetobacterium sp.]